MMMMSQVSLYSTGVMAYKPTENERSSAPNSSLLSVTPQNLVTLLPFEANASDLLASYNQASIVRSGNKVSVSEILQKMQSQLQGRETPLPQSVLALVEAIPTTNNKFPHAVLTAMEALTHQVTIRTQNPTHIQTTIENLRRAIQQKISEAEKKEPLLVKLDVIQAAAKAVKAAKKE
jgi:hypothetical protein